MGRCGSDSDKSTYFILVSKVKVALQKIQGIHSDIGLSSTNPVLHCKFLLLSEE